ncbi:hypothetical protein AYR72_gp039 [Cnaphalocrocis medinalis granulovirus]|uniref:Uncharacterized protein n=2 Tax=Cnaphalocrocis medinalis granulovirus TaxID=1750712 RepID=A0A109WZT4_9BBAC|nr:hypothetical protein AYR72_gp039 [Cnaphalocrocis medinalis granulovirus]AMF83790.1 hypothetical protein [Cnaphalocrocis medinalis granulovirus]WPN08669.1 hypothetical protein [Cnaphalocrocis medinalis granulovirus]
MWSFLTIVTTLCTYKLEMMCEKIFSARLSVMTTTGRQSSESSTMCFELENEIVQLNKQLDVYKLAVESLKHDMDLMKQERKQMLAEHQQHNQIVSMLSDQLTKTDNDLQESQEMCTNNKKNYINIKNELLNQIKINKILKRKIKIWKRQLCVLDEN